MTNQTICKISIALSFASLWLFATPVLGQPVPVPVPAAAAPAAVVAAPAAAVSAPAQQQYSAQAVDGAAQAQALAQAQAQAMQFGGGAARMAAAGTPTQQIITRLQDLLNQPGRQGPVP